MCTRRAGEDRRYVYAYIAEKAHHVAGPADGDHRRGKAIFKQQQRAHDPGREFAYGSVTVGVGGAGDRQG